MSGSRNALGVRGGLRYIVLGCQLREVFPLPDGFQSPFDNIENAQDYLVLLSQAIDEARQNVAADLLTEANAKLPRRLEAVRLALYKLEKLEQHIKVSRRLLNDLRTLRRLLFEERTEEETASSVLDRKR
jgi:hypothetical protein